MKSYVYVLREPDIDENPIRYVGKSNTPTKRFDAHLSKSAKQKGHLGNWLRVVLRRNQEPLMEVVVDFSSEEEAYEIDQVFIAFYKMEGYDLVNDSEGGKFGVVSPEARARASAKITGDKHYMYGKKTPESTRTKISKANKVSMAKTAKAILQFDSEGVFVKEWFSSKDIEKELDINRQRVLKCCRQSYGIAYGYAWRYKSDFVGTIPEKIELVKSNSGRSRRRH